MPFKCIEPEKVYAQDSNLKSDDVKILQEWLKKQPHLPELNETQLLFFLYGCSYSIETVKTYIDTYFTVRTLCPELFTALPQDLAKTTANTLFPFILTTTPEGRVLILLNLLDTKVDNFNLTNLINLINMVGTLYIHQVGILREIVVVLDAKGISLGHLTKLNLGIVKRALYQLQEGAPIRIKEIHVINSIPLVDKVVVMVKPFLKTEFYNMLNFHAPKSEGVFKSIPKDYWPEDYGGKLQSCQALKEQGVKNLLDNYDFFKWHDNQKVDETKRVGKAKTVNDVFGVEGTFKKLEID